MRVSNRIIPLPGVGFALVPWGPTIVQVVEAGKAEGGGQENVPNVGSDSKHVWEARRVLLTEILLPRIARQGTVCLIPIIKRINSKSSN